MENIYRSHYCNYITKENIGEEIRLAGWVAGIRDHGGIIFIDLRDEKGVTQIVFHDASMLNDVRKETVISVTGKVILRDEETYNAKIPTGEVEVLVDAIEILGYCDHALPFEIEDSHKINEEVRLKYRYLDLRNKKLHDRILFRSKVISKMRRKMEDLGFTEITTPILTSSSPEGARDFLVPSRKHKGKFYALPQAPQQFKQLLMTSGFDRYFQIAPCFRDEDARADRSPGEFYQLDFEMSFATQEDVFDVCEQVLYDIFNEFGSKKVLDRHFKRITYNDAILKFGSDKPDLRNPLMISDLTDFFKDVEFKPFQGKPVRGIVVSECSKNSKSFFERMLDFALSIGMKGLGYIDVEEDGSFKGPIGKYLTEEKKEELKEKLNLKTYDTLFFISDTPRLVNKLAGQIRTELANRLGLIKDDVYEFCFITDFPMYEIGEESGKIEFMHNPFSMPQGGLEALETEEPLEIKAYQYDIVCNGVELSSGAVRNHRPDIMRKAFEIAGYSEEELKTKFSALYSAFQYGAPPHAGMAPGVDRIIMLLTGTDNIRDVIAFPMNSNAEDILTGAPCEVTEKQLREVHIKIR